VQNPPNSSSWYAIDVMMPTYLAVAIGPNIYATIIPQELPRNLGEAQFRAFDRGKAQGAEGAPSLIDFTDGNEWWRKNKGAVWPPFSRHPSS
jgi:hypothetical protein